MEVYGANIATGNAQLAGAGGQFLQNKYQFATYYGQKNMMGNNNPSGG